MLRLTRAQSRQIDRLAVERYHIPSILLMENAALSCASTIRRIMENDHITSTAWIVCGPGNNGGDGLAIARHLHNAGKQVSIHLATDPNKYTGDALTNWRIVQSMNLPTVPADKDKLKTAHHTLLVDALFGTGLTSPPRDPYPSLIAAMNNSGAPIFSVDIPSGIDCDTGKILGPHAIHAHTTVTFCAHKPAHFTDTRHLWGDTFIGDIGCPRQLIEEIAHPF